MFCSVLLLPKVILNTLEKRLLIRKMSFETHEELGYLYIMKHSVKIRSLFPLMCPYNWLRNVRKKWGSKGYVFDEPGKSTWFSGLILVPCTAKGCIDAESRSDGSVKALSSILCKNDAWHSVWGPSSRWWIYFLWIRGKIAFLATFQKCWSANPGILAKTSSGNYALPS